MDIGIFPSSWKHAIIIAIQNQENLPTLPQAIDQLAIIIKIIGKNTSYKLKSFLHVNPKHQFGFKTHYSTCYQIQRISELIVSGFEKKNNLQRLSSWT